jgi:hypothetical protein
MTNWQLFGKFLGFTLELAFIGAMIWGACALVWWLVG